LKTNTLKINKLPLISSFIGFLFLIAGFLIISNKNLGFVFVNFLSNIKKISPYFLLDNSAPIYKQWLGQFYIFGIITIILSFLFLFILLMVSIKSEYPRIYYLIFMFLLTFIISYFFMIIKADPHHDGIMIKPAIDVAEGRILFRESFTQYGALTTLLQAFAILIFGKYLIVIRLLTSFFYGLILVLLWIIFSRLLNKQLNSIFCIVWVLVAPFYLTALPWSSVYALFFLLIALYFLIVFIENKKLLYLFLTGLFISLTFWSRQPVGIFLLIIVFIFIIFLKFLLKSNVKFLLKNLSLFISGFLSMSLVFVIWLLINGSLKDWWLQTVKFSIQWNSQRMSLYGTIGFLLKCLFVIGFNYGFIWRLFPIINLIIFFWYLIRFFRKKILNKKEIIILSIVFVSFASWLQYYPGPDAGHAFWAATPMIGLSIYFIWKVIGILINLGYKKAGNNNANKFIYPLRKYKIRNLLKITVTLVILLLLFGSDIETRIKTGFNRLENNQIKISSPKVLRGLQFSRDDAIKYYKLGKIIENFNENIKGINLITTAEDALYLTFKENSKNFSPMYVNWIDFNLLLYPDYTDKLNRYITNERPLIVMTRGQFVPGYYELYSWDNYFISIPEELKDKYFLLFKDGNLKNLDILSKEQTVALESSLSQQIALYGTEKLTFNSLFFDNLLKSIPMTSNSNLWLKPLVEHRISATNVLINIINSKDIKTALMSYDDEKFIKFLYMFILDRQPDEAGFKQLIDALNNGLERDQVIKSLLDSDEWKKKCVEISLAY
jgi:hypothetical protein